MLLIGTPEYLRSWRAVGCMQARVPPARSTPSPPSIRRRISSAASSAEDLPELLLGDHNLKHLQGHVRRVKENRLTRWLMQTSSRALLLYFSVPVVLVSLLSSAHRNFPATTCFVEAVLHALICGACLLTACLLLGARSESARAQRRVEQAGVVACLLAFGVAFDPVLFVLQQYAPTFAFLWPNAWIEPSASNATQYLLLGLVTIVLSNIVDRASEAPTKRASWKAKLVPLIVMWACSEMLLNEVLTVMLHKFDYLLDLWLLQRLLPVSTRLHVTFASFCMAGVICGIAWVVIALRQFFLALARHPWGKESHYINHEGCPTPRTQQREVERLILGIIACTTTLLFVVNMTALTEPEGKRVRGLQPTRVVALELLVCLTQVFWPSNLASDGSSAIDMGDAVV
ncbi:hypothetical protein AB1Y20_015596 [Prymnesium parvum]|uniref:Dolichol kinase n=1 Tax=Prymnesium parvum TaxID=97485 RepID=A0AB34JYB3_PRYPA